MFRPKMSSKGTAILYCAKCIKLRVEKPKQAVTFFSGAAWCPQHLADQPLYQFLKGENLDDSYLQVD